MPEWEGPVPLPGMAELALYERRWVSPPLLHLPTALNQWVPCRLAAGVLPLQPGGDAAAEIAVWAELEWQPGEWARWPRLLRRVRPERPPLGIDRVEWHTLERRACARAAVEGLRVEACLSGAYRLPDSRQTAGEALVTALGIDGRLVDVLSAERAGPPRPDSTQRYRLRDLFRGDFATG